MAVRSYKLARGAERWCFIVDLPRSLDGKRRQKWRRGFQSEAEATRSDRDHTYPALMSVRHTS